MRAIYMGIVALAVSACGDAGHPGSASGAGTDSNVLGNGSVGQATDGGVDGSDTSNLNDGSSSGANGDGGSTTTCPPVDMVPDPVPGVCNPSTQWAFGDRLGISGQTNDMLQGVTPDLLTVAWSVTGVTQTTYWLVDRIDAALPLGIPVSLPFASTANKIALAPNGLRVVVVNDDLKSFGEALRASRIFPFGGVGEGSFSLINADVRGTSDTITDPAISASDKVLVYTRISPDSASTLWISVRGATTDPWPKGDRIEDCVLQMRDGKKKSPLSISDDARTLYFRDELSALTRIAYRTGSDQPFTKFVDLPAAIVTAIPNATCDKLFYSANGTGLLDLFQASATP